MDKPIPAFYCCYLLRSTVRHACLYIGSTPNPVRRLNQHNGVSKGGACRTSRHNLRPWEMTCIVSGFPSKIAALQFEWAWQNTHTTRHIPGDERITEAQTRAPLSSRTGNLRRRPARPRVSLSDKLLNLQLLLCVKSFALWPLEVRFFAKDVFNAWRKLTGNAGLGIREGISIIIDQTEDAPPVAARTTDIPGGEKVLRQVYEIPGALRTIDVTHGKSKHHVEKSISFSNGTQSATCAVCSRAIHAQSDMFLVCPGSDCRMVSHLTCLARQFLAERQYQDATFPTNGKCPGCSTNLPWVDLVRDLSLRIRGKTEVDALLARAKTRQGESVISNDALARADDAHREAYESDEDSDKQSVYSGDMPLFVMPDSPKPKNVQSRGHRPRHDWMLSSSDFFELGSDDSEDVEPSDLSPEPVLKPPRKTQRLVDTHEIGDSDWESADILE